MATKKVVDQSGYLKALQRVADHIRGFTWVANPATQFSQRDITATVTVSAAGKQYKLPLERFIPARLRKADGTVLYDKRFVRDLLIAYARGSIGNAAEECITLVAYLAAKVMTSRPRSLEGAMSAGCLAILAEVGVSPVMVNESDAEEIGRKQSALLEYLALGVDAGFITAVRASKRQPTRDLGI
jgi:hypothetical protein